MNHAFSSVIAILVSISLFFLMPFLYAYERLETTAQYYVLSESILFVDEICNTGFLSKEMYDQFQEVLSSDNRIYEIELEHQKSGLVLGENSELNLYKEYADEEDMLAMLEAEGCYEFSQNDLLRIRIKCTKHGLPGLFASDGIVAAVYGGRIRYEVD